MTAAQKPEQGMSTRDSEAQCMLSMGPELRSQGARPGAVSLSCGYIPRKHLQQTPEIQQDTRVCPSCDKAHGLGIQPEYTSQAYRARYLQEVAPHATKG